jgi:lipid-binding SYLF domain-containing protein
MQTLTRRHVSRLAVLAGALAAPGIAPAQASTRREIDAEVAAALTRLHELPNTAPLLRQAKATLVFPRIVSGGFIVGGQYGEGALLRGGRTDGYYAIGGLSLGLLAGAQAAGLAMFFMQESALAALQKADGWEIGTGPSVVALDKGLQANASITTLAEPVYAITFGQQGLMAALALNGTKITKINPGA